MTEKTKLLKKYRSSRKKAKPFYMGRFSSDKSWLLREIKVAIGCEVCGYNRSPRALHYHHLDPTEKTVEISHHTTTMAQAIREIAQCIIVCANCHAEIHEDA